MNQLVKSVSIDNMVNQRAAVADRISQALALLIEARDIAVSGHLGFPRFRLETNRNVLYTMLDEDKIADTNRQILSEIDADAWKYLMNESGLRSLMDSNARQKWDENLYKGDVPPLTIDNVHATFQTMHDHRGEMFERGVLEVFRRLSWCYKTNKPFAFGKRLIITNVLHYAYANAWGSANHRVTDELDDLLRVLHVLDGKPEPDHRNGGFHAVHVAVSDRETRGTPFDVLGYFTLKLHKNGNGHLTFTRPDLVEKMNLILHRHFPGALPYDAHTKAA